MQPIRLDCPSDGVEATASERHVIRQTNGVAGPLCIGIAQGPAVDLDARPGAVKRPAIHAGVAT